MSKISEKLWERSYEKAVEIKYAETHWPVYEEYELRGAEGFRHLCAPGVRSGCANEEAKSINPLTPEYAGLFLEFARWFDKHEMDKGTNNALGVGPSLDTPRNGEAALAWAHEYGLLGLGRNPDESFAVTGGVISSSAEIAAEKLVMPNLAHSGARAYRKSDTGGENETVERFAAEAYEANIVLKLYEAATAPTMNVPAIARFMSKRSVFAFHLPAKYRGSAKTERETWSRDADDARDWALAVVEETVTGKVENDVYPTLAGEPGSYKEAWGFKSLLGAMWLQMRYFMIGEDNLCPACGQLFHKTRRDKTYCSDQCSGRARARKQYARKKRRAEEIRETTRKRLRR